MCNDCRSKVDGGRIRADFAELEAKIGFSEGVPNMEPRDDVKITDIAPIGGRASF